MSRGRPHCLHACGSPSSQMTGSPRKRWTFAPTGGGPDSAKRTKPIGTGPSTVAGGRPQIGQIFGLAPDCSSFSNRRFKLRSMGPPQILDSIHAERGSNRYTLHTDGSGWSAGHGTHSRPTNARRSPLSNIATAQGPSGSGTRIRSSNRSRRLTDKRLAIEISQSRASGLGINLPCFSVPPSSR